MKPSLKSRIAAPAVVAALALATLAPGPAAAQGAGDPDPPSQPLKCDMGPLPKTYGGMPWLLFSCADNRTLLIVAAPGNPTVPFYFVFKPHGKGHQLTSEGKGRRELATAALVELKLLSEREISELIKETQLN